MFELMLCSMVTILPDYLYRRYVQGKRLGKEINLYSVWFELRWGIIACLMLTVGLIVSAIAVGALAVEHRRGRRPHEPIA